MSPRSSPLLSSPTPRPPTGRTERTRRPARQIDTLQHSAALYRLMVEAVKDYAIFMLDPDGYIISWNDGAERIKGYSAEEILGQHFSVFYPESAIETGWPDRELEIAREEGRVEDEGWRLRKDGSRFWAVVVITALYDEAGTHVGYTKVTRDMTERRRMESLELAERRMAEFLAMLSHELRNPLAPIRNAVGTMYLKDLEDPDLRWARDVVDRQVKHLTRLVEDLLDINRITSGTIRLRNEPVRLSTVVERAIEASEPFISSRGHRLEARLTEESLIVNGDSTRLTQVVNNLLNNAAKYTPEGGLIEISLEREEDLGLIRVRDNGVGIPEDLLRHVFDLFMQGERTLDRSEGGLGIGLTLVRELVARHGGSVRAFSKGPGHGSEFCVRLPLVRKTAVPVESEARPVGLLRNGTAPARILVVDDNPDIAESMVMLLDMWGFEARSAHDGAAAVELARTFRPGIVFLDIGLPVSDGFEVARQLQTLDNAPAMQLIALTGYGQSEDIRRTREAGFAHHLVKPADPDELLELLEKMTGSQVRGKG